MTALDVALPLTSAQLDAQVRERLNPILASIPEGWDIRCKRDNIPSHLYTAPREPAYLLTRAYIWYEEALRAHANHEPWASHRVTWAKAFPPGSLGMEEDDLGYANFVLIADLKKTWETGVLS